MKRIALTFSFAGTVFFCGCQSSNDEETLVVGMELNYPPFEMKNERGEPHGISIDLAKALGEHLGQEVKIRDIAWEGLIPALKTGQLDCVISSMTITEERAQSIDFSDPYVKNGICLLVQKDGGVESFEDLKSEKPRIAVKLGTTGHIYAQEHLPNADLAVLRDAGNCALEVAQGRADAFLYDQVSIFQYWEKHAETTRALLEPVREEVWGVGIRKGNDELRLAVNEFLAKYRAEGGFDRLGDKWLEEWKVGFEEMGVSFVF